MRSERLQALSIARGFAFARCAGAPAVAPRLVFAGTRNPKLKLGASAWHCSAIQISNAAAIGGFARRCLRFTDGDGAGLALWRDV